MPFLEMSYINIKRHIHKILVIFPLFTNYISTLAQKLSTR